MRELVQTLGLPSEVYISHACQAGFHQDCLGEICWCGCGHTNSPQRWAERLVRIVVLSVLACSLAWGQTLTFTPQYSYGPLTLWQVDAQGAASSIPAQYIWPAAAAHKIGHLDPMLMQALLTKAQSTSGWMIAQKACTVAGAGAAIGAYIKGQANWANDPVATKIAVGATAVAGLCGMLLPAIERQAPASPPAVSVIGAELLIGANGCGSGMFWSLQGGEPFVEPSK